MIDTNFDQSPLEITGEHLVCTVGSGKTKSLPKLIPAREIQVGDGLLVQKLGLATTNTTGAIVKKITKVQRDGIYAPFTNSGDIVVNGAVASNYFALPSIFQLLLSFDQQHWLQHGVHSLYRLKCKVMGCEDEKYYADSGVSPAVWIWMPIFNGRALGQTYGSSMIVFSSAALLLVTARSFSRNS